MPRWSRRSGHFLVKSRRIGDGELLHLLTGDPSGGITDLDKEAYASLLGVKAATSKSLIWTVGFTALGVLAHFNMLRAASAGGLELTPTISAHVSLVGAGITGAWFCFNYTKQTFLQTWFSWKFKTGTPAFKTRCLLLFPEAYWHFFYLPANIGYPPFHMARRSTWPQLLYLLLVLVTLIIGSVGSIGLWIMLARDVLTNSQIGHTISVGTVIFSAAMLLLGWLSPFRYDFARRYDHMGLVSLLSKLDGERNREAHRRLLRVAARMGLAKL